MQSDDSDSDSDVAFMSMDFSGVNFEDASAVDDNTFSENDEMALALEKCILILDESIPDNKGEVSEEITRIRHLCELISSGKYVDVLKSESATELLNESSSSERTASSVMLSIRNRLLSKCKTVTSCVEAELIGVAALNLFLQLNYTGPSLGKGLTPAEIVEDPLVGINPHACFREQLHASKAHGKEEEEKEQSKKEEKTEQLTTKVDVAFQNAVLSELAVDGEWPCQVCQVPYFLLVARSILLTLAAPERADWTHAITSGSQSNADCPRVPVEFPTTAKELAAPQLWNARAALAHERLLQSRGPSVTLWDEIEAMFHHSLSNMCEPVEQDMQNKSYKDRKAAAAVVLEWGLTQHHFDREGKGKKAFLRAKNLSGLEVEVTGAEGKRTKFQQKATAQMLVKAKSLTDEHSGHPGDSKEESSEQLIKAQMVEYDEEGVLLENVKFEDEDENKVDKLTILDQAIILSLCLDVKNSNPNDGLTGEQMGAYLARVLHHHDDWMVYSTALLERAWVECEKPHGRERAILQIQALTDQHTNRLTITQSTMQSVEESAPVEERLKHLHLIVYPPRWSMLEDLAGRYAKIGIVTSAAEIFEELEMWDEVVECYRHAGKESKAEQIVRERLAEAETPRMWAALGDLTNDPSHYEKALQVSKGRFSSAYVALGKHHFDHGEIRLASDYYKKALKIKPLTPQVWFRLGTASMQLGEWDTALTAFTEVVQQEPEEADAWANVAAVHMHNKNAAKAYPALLESLKYGRNNWRVWSSKLYTCIDLGKYDEAIQACNVLMDFKAKKNMSEAVPPLEEACVKAIVGGTLRNRADCIDDPAALQSSARSMARVHELLERLSSTTKPEPWIWETLAAYNEQIGNDKQVYDNLMKEYRALQSVGGWEKDAWQVRKVFQVVSQIVSFHKQEGTRQSLAKGRLLVSGVIQKVRAVYIDDSKLPEEVAKLENLLSELEGLLK